MWLFGQLIFKLSVLEVWKAESGRARREREGERERREKEERERILESGQKRMNLFVLKVPSV
jgi:hypothetical protein